MFYTAVVRTSSDSSYFWQMKKLISRRNRIFGFLILLSLIAGSCALFQSLDDQPTGIQMFGKVEIGEMKQAVMVRGASIHNPVMVYLHGGPGVPLFPFEPSGETMRQLEQKFTMVYWEQRGTGKSFSRKICPESMNISQFVEDAREVIEFALGLTGQQKAFIWGHSWGSNVGAKLASKYPELIHAYIATGQSVNPFVNERLNYEFVLQRAREENNRKALRQLARIDTLAGNYSLSDALTVRKWVFHYGGVVKSNDEKRPYFDLGEVRQTLSSPFYTLGERFNMIRYPYFSAQKLWEELKEINLAISAPRIEVPVYFLLGRYDIIVSALLAESYYHLLDAPAGKNLVWFEQSAHRPHREERDKFVDILKNHILPEVIDVFREVVVTNP